MKKLLLISALTLASLFAFSQDSYTATNGRTYKLGDTIKLGKGSGVNGIFSYLSYTGINDAPINDTRVKRKFTNGAVVLKKIREKEQFGVLKATFIVTDGLKLQIDPAIEAKEVID